MINLEISIGPYIIRPSGNRPDGRVLIEVLRADCVDEHDHPSGPTKTVDVDKLFEEQD